ncbi:hypothetical protein ON010_g18625 [Phytophthora cinnamomi]|nr:hypothetical protein ON010_g18625 [Phytophthora cinnamomi]
MEERGASERHVYAGYEAWRYLLEKTHCGLYDADLQRNESDIGQKEEAMYGNVILPRLSWTFASVERLHDSASDEYANALATIAAFDVKLTPGGPLVDVKVPVRVGMDYEVEDDKPVAKKLYANLITPVFGNVRRPTGQSTTTI